MMQCHVCGSPIARGASCQRCAGPGQDPYAGLATPPAQGRVHDPYLMGESWEAAPAQAPTYGPPPSPPGRKRSKVALLVAAGVFLVGLSVGVTMMLLGGRDSSVAVPAAPSEPATTPSDPGEPSAAPTRTVFRTVEPEPTQPTQAATEVSQFEVENEAARGLEDYRQASKSGLVLDERWVAELSAKSAGIYDARQVAKNGTHTFYLDDILAMHEEMVERFAGVNVLLLERSDWGKQGIPLWFTIADPGGLTSKEDVEAWCAASFPELSGPDLANQCTPRQLKAPYWK